MDVTYATSAAHRVLGKTASVVVRDGAGAIVAETHDFYDGADYTGLPLGQAERGLLTRRLKLAWTQADFAAHYDASMDGAVALGFVAGDDGDGVASQFVAEARHAYDARGLQIGDMDPLGAISRFTFDAEGLFKTLLSGPLGDTAFAYDRGVGQPARISYPGGDVVTFRYDAQGRVRSSLTPLDDPAHPPRQYAYDDTVVPGVRTITMLQTKAGDVSSRVLTYFDGRGNEVQHRVQTDPATFVVTGRRAFNPWGDLKAEFEPTFSPDTAFGWPAGAAPSRTLRYDARGRVVRTVNYTGGVSTARYQPFAVELADADDNDASAENAARGQANTPRREEFDVLRRRTAIVELLGGGDAMTTRFVNDTQGRTIEVDDALGALCTYRTDLLGNRYQVDHRAAGRRKLWFDARGKVVRSLDAAGNDLRVALDVLGRLQRLTSGGAVLEEYTYDDAGADALGRISKVVYQGGSQQYRYDVCGRLTRADFAYDASAATHRIDYEYDYLGREIARVHADGTRIAKTLTFNGWTSAISNVITAVTYDPRGLATKIAYANGVTSELGYLDGPGRVASQKTVNAQGQVYEDVTYGFDLMGMLLSSSDAAPGGRGQAAYAYDPLYQLASVTTGGPGAPVVRGYGYFNYLNLARTDETNAVFAFDDAAHPDRIAGMTVGGGARSDLAYDANGNLLGLADKSFAFDQKNELVRVTRADGTVARYAYDPKGQRVSKTVTDKLGAATTTLFAGSEVEIRGGHTFHFVYLGERRVAILSDGEPRFVHTDYAGNTVFFSSPQGVKLASIVYRPFGNVDRSNGAVDDRTFGLHPFDLESGLYYMRRRYYSPDLGRFITPDPFALHQVQKVAGNPKALHPYAYAGSDPLNNVDYDGLSFWSVVGAIVGVIVALAVAVAVVVATVMTGGLAGIAIGALLAIGIVSVSYVVAKDNAGTGLGEFFRGFMIGFNAGLNAVIATALFGPVIGIALGVINFLAAFDSIAGSKIYQGILGWASWVMPMSWLATAIGLVFFVVNVIVAGVTLNKWDAAKIDKIGVHWETGTIVMTGGLIHAFGSGIAFDVGNFAYLNRGHSDAELHETGHALGVAAFGSIFHFVGAIEQATSSDFSSYSEHLAESHDPHPDNPASGTWWHMWGSPA
jgi:RHS repeat-associated protein